MMHFRTTNFCSRTVRTVLVALASWLAGSMAVANASARADRPNIVFIFSDDHALEAISAYGGRYKEVSPTPNIDRLADEGMLFENSFCGNSICGPSRATILTGKHSNRKSRTPTMHVIIFGV